MPKRNDNKIKIEEMLSEKPWLTLQEIGDELGISRERVRQIIKQHNIHKGSFTDRTLEEKYSTELISQVKQYLTSYPFDSVEDTAKRTGLTVSDVEQLRKELKLEAPQAEKVKADGLLLKEYIDKKSLNTSKNPYSAEQIAKHFGWSIQKLNNIQRKFNLDIYYPVGNRSSGITIERGTKTKKKSSRQIIRSAYRENPNFSVSQISELTGYPEVLVKRELIVLKNSKK